MEVLVSVGILLIRLVVGLAFIGHGAQKLFGSFGGHGLEGTGGFFESIGIKPGKTMALFAGLSEFVGGLLFVLGLLTPIASLLIIITMIVAISKVHAANGFWAASNGYELNLLYIVTVLSVAFTGAGAYSLDALLF
ncbi:DoxX family protein [Niallia nealsonii]|uniref:Oxidoreductase n=1 Tax=Niallia nealsonii TaxID=115979 RepID=A0A2N0Z7B1_9BACI|nr:DoxX family protein [Niallia nealsonii]PKG25390.1 oxidoreductase [Niallia nealsonii]